MTQFPNQVQMQMVETGGISKLCSLQCDMLSPPQGYRNPLQIHYQEQRAYSNDVSTNNSRDEYSPREADSVQNNGGFSDANADSSQDNWPAIDAAEWGQHRNLSDSDSEGESQIQRSIALSNLKFNESKGNGAKDSVIDCSGQQGRAAEVHVTPDYGK